MGIIEDVFQMEGKECKVQERLKMKIHARARKVLQDGINDFVWTSGSGGGEIRGSRKKFSGREGRAEGKVRLHRARGGARKDSLWLCYARSLAEKQKSEISGNWQRSKPIPWEKSS